MRRDGCPLPARRGRHPDDVAQRLGGLIREVTKGDDSSGTGGGGGEARIETVDEAANDEGPDR
ncbi:hypothetical protein [Streptomyces sp. NBC_01471]|uniref:hypothetical protein n=1 Tax=Streptomyces sp. NBC_01471 TaxID=2903879 RepID=UPI00352DA93F